MRFHEAAAILLECRALNEAEFGRLHPNPAFLIEPFSSVGGPIRDTTMRIKKFTEDNLPSGAPLHPKARLCWITATRYGAGGVPEWPVLRFGRDEACEVSLPHPSISKAHAVVRRVAEKPGGGWVVEDSGSTNGTELNGHRLTPHEPANLVDNDTLVLGQIVAFRPFFTPGALYKMLRSVDLSTSSSRLPLSSRVDLELLATTLRALGMSADTAEGELKVKSLDGAVDVRVRRDSSAYAVEWGPNAAYLKRKTVALNDAKLEETLRRFVLEAVGFMDRSPGTGTPRP